MDTIKQYWMPAVAGLCVISGLGDFNLTAIMLGVGFGIVWWRDVREHSSIDKKSVAFKIVQWLLVGVSCDQIVCGNVVLGIVLLCIVIAWVRGVFSRLTLPKMKGKKRTSGKDKISVDKRSPLEKKCDRILDDIYSATAKTNYWIRDVAEYAGYRAHKITHIDVFPYSVLRVRMTTESRVLTKVKMPYASKADAIRLVNPAEVDIWQIPEGENHAGCAVEECEHCHGKGNLECPTCHGTNTHWECPDCHGEKGLKHECQTCHGKGESKCSTCQGKGIVTCEKCKGRGETCCSVCHGLGWVSQWDKYENTNVKATCPNCHGKGTDTCIKCGGSGESRCGDCGGRGMSVCKSCDGSGRVLCGKCDSTGMAYCHTCNGTGKIKCSKCGGDGGFAYSLKVQTSRVDHEVIKVSAEKLLPKAVMPTRFIERFPDCKKVYHTASTSATPDDSMVLSEEALKFPKLKEGFDEVAAKVRCDSHTRLVAQDADVVEVGGIAKVEIQSLHDNPYNDYAGKEIVCWLNLATEELLDIWLKDERPDSWYENHTLDESKGSSYWLLNDAKNDEKHGEKERGLEKMQVASRLGNPIAAMEYGARLYEGKTPAGKPDKQRGRESLRDAECRGMPHSKYLDE